MGRHLTVLLYGQTGTGKTYTMRELAELFFASVASSGADRSGAERSGADGDSGSGRVLELQCFEVLHKGNTVYDLMDARAKVQLLQDAHGTVHSKSKRVLVPAHLPQRALALLQVSPPALSLRPLSCLLALLPPCSLASLLSCLLALLSWQAFCCAARLPARGGLRVCVPRCFAHAGPRAVWLSGGCKGGQLSEGIGHRVSRPCRRRGPIDPMAQEALELRMSEATERNANSSRSHAFFIVRTLSRPSVVGAGLGDGDACKVDGDACKVLQTLRCPLAYTTPYSPCARSGP